MNDEQLVRDMESSLLESFHSTKLISGLTHNFYRYPARMSPELARAVITQLSNRNDLVLDPFMGGGTTIVEAVAAGRRAVGLDLNPLATFVTAAKTTPLSYDDQLLLEQWAWRAAHGEADTMIRSTDDLGRLKNLPEPIIPVLAKALKEATRLPLPRQERFARCVLLRLGQWAVDCKLTLPDEAHVQRMLVEFAADMLRGLNQFVEAARLEGIPKNKLTGRRTLLQRSSVDAHEDPRLAPYLNQPKLVFTSPPYPGVHVLYHRWQVTGRRETPAPFWLIDREDGRGASYYTLGSRSAFGLTNYFRSLLRIFGSIRRIIHPEGLVVQLVSFADPTTQLPDYLKAMEEAGFDAETPIAANAVELWRRVPNRKWYYRVGASQGETKELLLFHRPRMT